MGKVENFLYKLHAIMINIFMVLFFLFSVYAVIGPLHNKSWKLLMITFFMFLLGITGILFSYHTYLQAFKGIKSVRIIKLFDISAIVTFAYMTALASYMHFIEHYPGSFKMIIYGGAATALVTYRFLMHQKKEQT
ncbi:hypothetical protein D920_02509 [Enterococcus faecalis 13-SD-W-01]|nr:hypothetical protein D920_02509 [Enterococcus faecalis 13-SD-W-01]